MMPRPRKCKNVCCLPESNLFGSLNGSVNDKELTIMSVEEYETIRLIDLEGLTQEQCADSMNVARTTVQRIYNEARVKIAKSIVKGNIIKIEGGDYKLCENAEQDEYGCRRCCRKGSIKVNNE